MRRTSLLFLALAITACGNQPSAHADAAPATPSPAAHATAGEPDYSQWNGLLKTYYDPAKGMDYSALKSRDAATVQKLRQQWAQVSLNSLNKKQQLAYLINLYNVNVVGTVVEGYPVKSIRDLSTDPIIRLNVFKKERVPFGSGKISLTALENRIRDGFHDPRIHFAINCAAKTCPPIRMEAYQGDKLDAQLDEQAKKFLNGPFGARVEAAGDKVVVHTTKIMDWFGEDFDKWGGGRLVFLRKYVSPDKQKLIDLGAGKADFRYDDYDWALNDAHR